jgi:2-hydroxyacyl-CoA lyase 1
MTSPFSSTGANLIAHTLHSLGVKAVFGIVGVPVSETAEECINNGIRFYGFRNEQAASYAASVYGYLTGTAGVCLVVGGPGVWHAGSGTYNAAANAFPMLLLAGSCERDLLQKGAFQEMDAVSLLTAHVKIALRPGAVGDIPRTMRNAFRTALFGRPGPAFVDLPADLIQGVSEAVEIGGVGGMSQAPKILGDEVRLEKIAQVLKEAKAPLVLIGKGAAYARSEHVIREFIDKTGIPFLPSPMGKGVVADSHPLNTASARSTVLREADVVLLLGARLNWIFHYGEAPKWNPKARFIQVDISPEEIGRNQGDAELGIVGDVNVVVPQLLRQLSSWKYSSSSPYLQRLVISKEKNEARSEKAALVTTLPFTYAHAFKIIKNTLHNLSPPEEGGIVYVSEGANTMDISRSIFPVEYPRLRLDAGTNATMGVGMAYAIAAHEAYNSPDSRTTSGPARRKKIVALEGDSAFGFSGMEVETMARYGMDVLIFVMNNSGIYHGDAATKEEWNKRQVAGGVGKNAMRSWSLGHRTRYEMLADACGGKGYYVETPEELEEATREGFQAGVPVVVNVILNSESVKGKIVRLDENDVDTRTLTSEQEFGFQVSAGPSKKDKSEARL